MSRFWRSESFYQRARLARERDIELPTGKRICPCCGSLVEAKQLRQVKPRRRMIR